MTGYRKIVVREFGDADRLRVEEVDRLPEPGEGEIRVRVEAAGVGYTDTIIRRGLYHNYTGGLPMTPGYDMVGVVDALGAGVSGFAAGDRVADMTITGGYTQSIVRPARDLLPAPAGVAPEIAVEVPLMWMTAWQMLTRVAPLPAGAPILVVGAGGAVGRALVLLGAHIGLRVIGTCAAGSMAEVTRAGATAIDYRRADLVEAIREASGGGVAAAFDAIAGDSWTTSWRALAPGGLLVAYGMQGYLDSGAPPSAAGALLQKLNQTWPEEAAHDGTGRGTRFYDISVRRKSHPEEYRADVAELFGLIEDGTLRPPEPEVLPLEQAPEAHRRVAEGGLDHRLVLRP